MLAKKKAERQQAIAVTASAERKKELQRIKRVRNEITENEGKEVNSGKRHRTMQEEELVDSMGITSEDPNAVIRAIGDHINTRFQELEFDDELDADVFDEQQRQLREEAAIASGTKTRILAPQIAGFLQQQQQLQKNKEKEKNINTPGVQMLRVSHNSNAITAVCSFGSDLVILGDKSGAVYVAELHSNKTEPSSSLISSQKALLNPYLPAAILSIAVSDTRGVRPSQRAIFERSTVDTSITSYIAAGAADGTISIWVTNTRKHMGFLTMHRAAVTGLTFRHDTLYSCSHDETLRVWSIPQMMCEDKLFGHQGKILSIHCLRRERCASVGEDGAMRFWKVDAATQQEFSASIHFGVKVVLECVTMMSDTIVLCGATNGALLVFDVGRRKPLVVQEAAHGFGFTGDGTGLEKLHFQEQKEKDKKENNEGERQGRQNPNPITSVASIPYSDVAASASYDGIVRLWRLITPETSTKSKRKSNDSGNSSFLTTLECLASIPVHAIVTSLYFPPSSDILIIGCSKEPRLGRWVVQRAALNSVYIVPLSETTLETFATCPHIEHLPALLYDIPYKEEDEEDEEGEEGGMKENNENTKESSSSDISSSGEFEGESNGDEGLFTVGEDGQMQFKSSIASGDMMPSEGKVNKKKNKSLTNMKENKKKKMPMSTKKNNSTKANQASVEEVQETKIMKKKLQKKGKPSEKKKKKKQQE